MKPKERTPGIQSIQSVVRVVEEMAALGEAVGVTALANRIDMPKVRVFRYLRTLQDLGYVRQDPATEKYALTLRLFQIGQAVADATHLLREAKGVLAGLRERTGLTALLSEPEADGVRILDIARTEDAPIVLRPGVVFDFQASAQGRVCLAFGPCDLWENARQRGASKCTSTPMVSPEVIEAELHVARQRGWAATQGQSVEGVTAVAAPIFGPGDKLLAVMTLVGPSTQLSVPPAQLVLRPLLDATRDISISLGGSVRVPPAADGLDAASPSLREGGAQMLEPAGSARAEG